MRNRWCMPNPTDSQPNTNNTHQSIIKYMTIVSVKIFGWYTEIGWGQGRLSAQIIVIHICCTHAISFCASIIAYLSIYNWIFIICLNNSIKHTSNEKSIRQHTLARDAVGKKSIEKQKKNLKLTGNGEKRVRILDIHISYMYAVWLSSLTENSIYD